MFTIINYACDFDFYINTDNRSNCYLTRLRCLYYSGGALYPVHFYRRVELRDTADIKRSEPGNSGGQFRHWGHAQHRQPVSGR